MKKSTRARGRREGRPCTWRGSRRGTGGCTHHPWLGTARSRGGSWSRVRRQVAWGGPVPSLPRGSLRSLPTRAAPAPHPAPPVAVAGTPVTIWCGQQSFKVVSHVLTEGCHLCTLFRHIWDEPKTETDPDVWKQNISHPQFFDHGITPQYFTIVNSGCLLTYKTILLQLMSFPKSLF